MPVSVATAVLAFGLAGCGGGGRGDPAALDSVLIRTETLLTEGRDLEARSYLRGTYLTTPALWRGPSVPEGLRMLGELYHSAALFDSAFYFYDRSREEYRNLAQRSRAYQMTFAIGSLFLQMNRPHDARDLYEEALRLAVVFGDSTDARDLRWALLPVYAAIEDWEGEKKVSAFLLSAARTTHDRQNEARVQYESGRSLAARGRPAEAIDAFLGALTLADQARDSLLGAQALVHLGLALDGTGRSRDALETFGTAIQRVTVLARNPDLRIELFMRIGNLSLRQKENDRALQSFRIALPLAQKRRNALAEAYCTMQMGHATIPRNRTDALSLLRSGYDQFRAFGYGPGVAYALVSLGEIAEEENRLTDALQLYDAAARQQSSLFAIRSSDDLFEECETSALGPAGNDASITLVSLLLQLGQYEEAFVVQQRKNTAVLSSAFSMWRYQSGNPAVDGLLTASVDARSEHCGAERGLEQLMSSRPDNKALLREIHAVLQASKDRVDECAAEIQHISPRLAPFAGAGGVRPVDVQNQLEEGTAFLTFLPGRRSWYTSLITREQVSFKVTAQTSDQVLRSGRDYVHVLRERLIEADSLGAGYSLLDNQLRDLTRKLYEALVLPVELSLRPVKRLIVQFPAGMAVLPVHALRRSSSSGYPYLVDQCDVQYVATPHVLSNSSASTGAVQSVTCVGFPGFTGWDVEYELRDVRYFFKDAGMLFGREATIESLRKNRSDVLHMAVDIQFGLRAPLLGALYLSDGVSSTGYRRVPLSSLAQLPANRLVIVSNLSSMPLTLDPGLAFTFAANGSEGIVMNVVPPLRGAKKAFSEYLYTALATGASPEVAFRKAQQEMIKKREFSAPQYWAPFLYWKGN